MIFFAIAFSLALGIALGYFMGTHDERKRWETGLIQRSVVDRILGTADSRATHVPHDARQDHLEQAVDAIAVELERVAEGQRFVTRLLAERERAAPNRPIAAPERVITPH